MELVTTIPSVEVDTDARTVEVVKVAESTAELLRAKRCADFAATAIICAGCPMLKFCGQKIEGPNFMTNDTLQSEPLDTSIFIGDDVLSAGMYMDVSAPQSTSAETLTARQTYREQLFDDTVLAVVAESFVSEISTPSPERPVTAEREIDSLDSVESNFDVVVAKGIYFEPVLPVSEVTPKSVDRIVEIQMLDEPIEEIQVSSEPAVRVPTSESIVPTQNIQSVIDDVSTIRLGFGVEVASVDSADESDITERSLKQVADETAECVDDKPVVLVIDGDLSQELPKIETPSRVINEVRRTPVPLEAPVRLVRESVIEPIVAAVVEIRQAVVDFEVKGLDYSFLESSIDETVIEPDTAERPVVNTMAETPNGGTIDAEFWLQQVADMPDDVLKPGHHDQSVRPGTDAVDLHVLEIPLIDSDSIDPEFRLLDNAQAPLCTVQVLRHLALQALRGLLINIGSQRAVIR